MTMKIRMTHVWWIGVVVFTPAILVWGYAIVGLGVQGRLEWQLGWYHMRYVFLPLLAAVIGFGVPGVPTHPQGDAVAFGEGLHRLCLGNANLGHRGHKV